MGCGEGRLGRRSGEGGARPSTLSSSEVDASALLLFASLAVVFFALVILHKKYYDESAQKYNILVKIKALTASYGQVYSRKPRGNTSLRQAFQP